MDQSKSATTSTITQLSIRADSQPPLVEWQRVLPRMWTPRHHYYRPQHHSHPNPHHIHCCLSGDNLYGCRHPEYNRCANCLKQTTADGKDGPMNETNGELSDHMSDPLAPVMALVRDTQLSWLKTCKRLAVDWLDVRKQDLKLMTQLVADQSERFGGDPSMVQSLKAFSQQMNEALIAIKEQKKRFKREVSDMKAKITLQMDLKCCQQLAFDMKSVPEIGHFLAFYKDLLDKMADRMTEAMPQSDDIMNTTLNGDNNLSFVNDIDVKPLDYKQSPEEHNITAASDDVVPEDSEEVVQNETIVDTTDDSNRYRVVMESPFSDDMNHSLENSIDTQMKELVIDEEPYDSVDNNPNIDSNSSPSKVVAKQMEVILEANPSDAIEAKVEPECESPATGMTRDQLTEPQRKLLGKLVLKYPDLCDELLIDAMTATKESLIRSGQPKGFSGLKVAEIIAKISDYIESEVSAPATDGFMVANVGCLPICGVCSQRIDATARKQTLSCGHPFHLGCIQSWAQTNNRCPNCCQHMMF